MGGSTHRQFQRRLVDWPASCEVAGESVSGRVLDYSWGGAFFSPDHARAVPRGERIELAVESSQGHRLFEFIARVVWSGESQTHACSGFGVEFEPTPPPAASA